MQALPLLALLLVHPALRRRVGVEARARLMFVARVAYLAWTGLLTWQALRGQSIVALLALPGNAQDIALVGSHAYVASWRHGLHVVDVGNPHAPDVVTSLAIPGPIRTIRVWGDRAYLAAGKNGLYAVDISRAGEPEALGAVPTGDYAFSLNFTADHIFVADRLGGLLIFSNTPNTDLNSVVVNPQ